MTETHLPAIFPRIETDRLVLRELSPDDAAALFRNFSDAEVVKYIMPPLTDIERASAMLREWADGYRAGKSLMWALTRKPGGGLLGTCGFEEFSWADRRGEVGYDIARTQWGKGLMSEAMRAVIYYGFSELDLNRIEAHTLLANARSVQLLRRLGFREEGTFRQRTQLGGGFWDQGFFALLRQDWQWSKV